MLLSWLNIRWLLTVCSRASWLLHTAVNELCLACRAGDLRELVVCIALNCACARDCRVLKWVHVWLIVRRLLRSRADNFGTDACLSGENLGT